MALGAIFGALNSMYAAVAARTREIATLRAIGFRGLPVIVSVLIETMLLAAAGGMLGAGLAWLMFDHYTASTLGANFSQVVFSFQVSPSLLGTGLDWHWPSGSLAACSRRCARRGCRSPWDCASYSRAGGGGAGQYRRGERLRSPDSPPRE